MSRLVFVGEAVLDVVTWLSAWPERGGDTVAAAATMTAGGGFNVMVAAARHGAEVLYAGRHGTGPAGDAVRAALAAEGIRCQRAADPTADTGFVVTMVDPTGERTFVTSPAALATLGAAELEAVVVRPGDVVAVSGYGLIGPDGADLAGWTAALPGDLTVVADPGSLVEEIPGDRLDALVGRADWWSSNAREAAAVTGVSDPATAAGVLARRRAAAGGVVVRSGAAGCVLVERGAAAGEDGGPTAPLVVAAPAVDVVDTTGAGDTHVGVMVAGLVAGLPAPVAVTRASVAAALSAARRGPATAPAAAELDAWLALHPEWDRTPRA